MNIRLWHAYPPIPIRSFDWCATLADYDEGHPMGWGSTPGEAVQDLYNQLHDQ